MNRRSGPSPARTLLVPSSRRPRNSGNPDWTAEMVRNGILEERRNRCATDVFPQPGGPHRMADPRESSSIPLRRGAPGPNRSGDPTSPSKLSGRMRSAKGLDASLGDPEVSGSKRSIASKRTKLVQRALPRARLHATRGRTLSPAHAACLQRCFPTGIFARSRNTAVQMVSSSLAKSGLIHATRA